MDVTIEATVDADLRTFRGTMTLDPSFRDRPLLDVLQALPDPVDDLNGFRTFPGRPDRGRVDFTQGPDGVVTFEAHLPRRYGAIGATSRGLFANGGWYPQPEGLPTLDWRVTVTLPDGAGAALGDVAGDGVLTWEGRGERVGLAVVDRPTYTALDGNDVLLLSQGRARKVLVDELSENLALLPVPVDGIVVEAPLRRRLTAHGPGLGFVSDRAFRVTRGLGFVHRSAVTRGLAAAWVEGDTAFERELAAAALGRVHDRRAGGLRADRVLGVLRWIPEIDALVSNGRMPFYGEVLGRVWPTDPVKDDLAEVVAPYAPGAAVLAQLDDRFGPGSGERVGLSIAGGDPLEVALESAGLPADALDGWQAAFPAQDWTLSVDGDATIARQAPADAPVEAIVARVDGEDRAVVLGPGESATIAGPFDRIRLDPGLHTLQADRTNESWPPSYFVTAAAAIDTVVLTQGQIFGAAWLTARRQYDTHNLWVGAISNSRSDLVTVEAAYVRKEGPLLDAFNRPHRFRFDVSASVLNNRFADTPVGQVALDTGFSWTHDDRVSSEFPLRGHRFVAAVNGGGIPTTPLTWWSWTLSATGVGSPHPRVSFVQRLTGSMARSPLAHRLLVLGGSGAMRSIPLLPACQQVETEAEPGVDCFPVATERLVDAFEARWAVIRNASVPMILGYGTDLQLTAGPELLIARVDGEQAFALGVVAGVLGSGAVFGVDNAEIGLTAGWPVWSWYLDEVQPTAIPELYLRFEQNF